VKRLLATGLLVLSALLFTACAAPEWQALPEPEFLYE